MTDHGDDPHFRYYPAFLNLHRKRVVVIGGGAVALRKIAGLLPCGPSPLVVVAPQASPTIQEYARSGQLEWHDRPFSPGDTRGASLVIAATSDRALNARVAAEARRLDVLVQAVDDTPNCDVIAAAIITRGDLVVAVSTGGRSPALARFAREHLEQLIPSQWGELLEVAAQTRERLSANHVAVEPDAWQAALRDPVLQQLVMDARREAAVAHLVSCLGAPPGASIPP